ncbi:hypothetical protein [Streptomyces sp. NL15-2K]|uniref:hypothetical protein n=1 Tax=Streptomyces sp. NL15-2K TaxID=376149 RepID=UPI000F5651AB|nr:MULTISPECIES: hypothetical protein [Actinomycetes]WKX05975.1 hypothetical protein Q4V64_00080 [Kutzneria buriramensis]WKX15969.1 hypothetical protein Q4V64_54230 [Kutzneria buriramensis]WKX16444.1 hypothetical protein Q4V64_54370 [Kutzneria buriramensis]GCB53506.1 hypothetical protein SNL152K_10863 [Streptomyces sp. NL15-2K]
MSEKRSTPAEVLVIAPRDAPFVAGSAADPSVHEAALDDIATADLFADLADSQHPLLHRTLDRLPVAGECEPLPQVVALTIGYMSRYQSELAAASEPVVVSSPLLAVPTLLAAIAPDRSILLVYADSRLASAADVPGVAEEDAGRLLVAGLEGPGPFRRAVIERAEAFDDAAILRQIEGVVAEFMASHRVGAVVLECGEMASIASRLRERITVPVVDYHLVIDFFRRASRKGPSTDVA